MNGLAQSSSGSSSLILRSNIQSNTAATTLHSSAQSSIKAQYVFGQTPLLGKVSVSGIEVRQGFIQPLSLSGSTNKQVEINASVFPNPFSNRLRIQFDNTPSHDVHASLFDMRGRLVYKLSFEKPTNSIDLELGHLAEAKYLLYINIGSQVITKHIIKHD